MAAKPQVVIVADRLGAELQPLSDRWPVPLLPVAGKPVIEHVIEALVEAGLREAFLVVSGDAGQVNALIEDGARWGMHLTPLLSRGEVAPSSLLPVAARSGGPWLGVRGDCLLTGPALAALLEMAEDTDTHYAATATGRTLLVWSSTAAALDALTWNRPAPPSARILSDSEARALDSLATYHRSHGDTLAGRLPGLRLPGREEAVGLWVGPRSQVAPQVLKQGRALVGAQCRIDPQAELLGETVIHDRVIVERGATLQDSVILPDSYVGRWIELNNAIVAGDLLLRVDTGAELRLHDAFLLGRLDGDRPGTGWREPLNRLLGLALFLLTLPLWPLVWLSAASPRWQATAQLGNRRLPDDNGVWTRQTFSRYRFNSRWPLLRHLPGLLAVLGGDLRLFGVSARPADAEPDEPWRSLRESAPRGLLGPAQLLGDSAFADEHDMADAWFGGSHGGRRWLTLAQQALHLALRRRGLPS